MRAIQIDRAADVARSCRTWARKKSGVNIISCPTCGRLQSDLLSAIKIVEEKTAHIKTPLNISVMGCVVNAIGEAKSADVAIAFGNGHGLGRAAEAACSAGRADILHACV